MYKILPVLLFISCRQVAVDTTNAVPNGINRPNKPPRTGLYYETKWDPLLDSKTSLKNLQNVLEMGGHYENHEITTPPPDRYGDLSLFTLNLASDISTVPMNQEIASYMHEILDHAHPTVFVLQGVRELLLAHIRKLINEHYGMLTDDVFTKDPLSSAHYYLPIFIDKRVVRPIKTGYFRNQKGQVYGSYVVLSDTRKGKMFTVVNIDLYSTFKGMVEGQLANIISDIKGDPSISNEPVFFAGGIGSLSPEMHKLLRSGYKNLVDLDPNNKELDMTTVHGKVEHSDGIQRDYIILRDPATALDLNYARILSKDFPVGEHFAVHAILSYTS